MEDFGDWENSMKVVIFQVKVPEKREDLKDQMFSSEPFTLEKQNESSTWRIQCNLSGRFKETDPLSVGVFLQCKSPKVPYNISYSFSVVKGHQDLSFEKPNNFVAKEKWKENHSFGHYNMVLNDDLYSYSEFFFPKGELRILMKVLIIEDPAPESKQAIDFSLSLEKMLNQEIFTDLIIKTEDKKQLKAHKSILCTRSKVFSKMFSTPKKEKLSGILKIDYEEAVVKELLKYIYCNKVGDISQIDIELFGAGQQYGLDGLQKLCLDSIYLRLDPENVIAIALFAKSQWLNLSSLLENCIIMMYA